MRGSRSLSAVCAMTALVGACRTVPAPRPTWCVEFEALGERVGGAREARLLASGGQAWGQGFGTLAEHRATLPVESVPPGPTRMWLRVAVPTDPACLLVEWGGQPLGPVMLPSTGQRDLFEWVSFSLGDPLEHGDLVLRGGGRGEVLVDLVAVTEEGAGPPLDQAPAVHVHEGQEIRCSSQAVVFDPPWVFQLLRRHERFVAHTLGFSLARRPILAAVSPAEWPDAGADAYQVGAILFLRSDRLHLPWRGYTHELVHVFQEEAAPTPRFFLEGVAHAVALWAERDLDGRREELQARLQAQERLLQNGSDEGGAEVSLLFRWGTESLSETQVAASYAWAKALTWSLAERHGADWLRQVYRVLRTPTDPDTRTLSAAAGTTDAVVPLLRILSRTAGEDLRSHLEQHGLVVPIGGPATPESGSTHPTQKEQP